MLKRKLNQFIKVVNRAVALFKSFQIDTSFKQTKLYENLDVGRLYIVKNDDIH